jgi:hypothetical protein
VTVKVYKAKYAEGGELYDDEDDYRFETPVFEESCWGFYGYEYAEEQLNDEYLPWAKRKIEEEEKAEIST